MAANLFV